MFPAGPVRRIGAIAAGLVVALTPSLVLAETSVGQWDRFEASVTNTNSYTDPYRDVALDVTYTRPDTSTVSFWGFHDGGTTWKIRFMPDSIGNWSYDASFSDGAPGIAGTFVCVASAIPGMLSRDETNPMWFGFKGGGHVLVRSFHVGDLFFADQDNSVTGVSWSDARRTTFLDWAQSQGYNMLSVASHYLNRETSGRGLGWDTPDLWDGAARLPRAAEYDNMEAILDDLSDRRMMIFPFAGFFGQSSDFPTDQADQELHVRYTLARVGPYWNVLFNVAGPEPLLKPAAFQNAMAESDINRLGALIGSLDVFGHPVSVHNATGDDPFMNSSWSSYGTLQGPKTTSRSTLSSGLLRTHHASKPLYAQETLWEGNQNHPSYSATDIRKNAYVITMSATALNFADMNGNSSSGFSGSLDLADLNGGVGYDGHAIVKKVWDFFETVPFYSMSPRQDLVDQGYCLAQAGLRYLVYLDSGGTVNVAVTGGPYTVEWINAQDTADTRSGGTTTDGQNLTAPAGADDWLVYLEPSGPVTTYTLRVEQGSGDGSHPEGADVQITADTPASGYVFDKWTGDVSGVADVNAATTTLTMPAADVTVTATYLQGIVIECEDMTLVGYTTEPEGYIRTAADSTGTATASFPGATGRYVMRVVIIKENDGQPTLDVYVDGTLVTTINYDIGSVNRDPQTIDLGEMDIANGAEIRLVGTANLGAVARVDKIIFTPAAADSDGDGLPDSWEQQYFGGLGQGPNDDFDGDGATNREEYDAGTNPADDTDFPRPSSKEGGCSPSSGGILPWVLVLALAFLEFRGHSRMALR